MKMTKRLLTLALVCLMLMSFVACGDDPPTVTTAPHNTVEYVAGVLSTSLPTKVVTRSTYVIDDLTLGGTATLLVSYGNTMDAKYEYRLEILNPAGTTDINGQPLMIGVVEDVKYSKGDTVASFDPITGDATYGAYEAVNQLNAMALPQNATVTEGADGTVTLVAVIANADIASVFGVSIAAVGDIQCTITVKNDQLVGFLATYQTALGQMTVEANYSYDKVSFDVK